MSSVSEAVSFRCALCGEDDATQPTSVLRVQPFNQHQHKRFFAT
jgi:hypothetical protein